ncbi:SGNH/GDSL hydrolase family protein [Pedobacter changchengzhani]|uniref:SGNH/GDSL hydrolase family protein n=1 Tax=Pedobacter changchengzhani TaxID=2529274 RepID=A0A4R5MPD4_9SPHI|nr:SGNH/GDSL hydrolase family protein [Pedobacter changchengzhani]TDG37185.1 SGNH/GDSL hydrolase family protein [Pedobacter changchengzhani]
MKLFLTSIIFSLFTSGCSKTDEIPQKITSLDLETQNTFTYLALGDSYTIGESVTPSKAFPYQLQALLNSEKVGVATPKIIARTGWTTGDLQSAIKAENTTQKYDFVTLLIGVNNQYRGYKLEDYKKEFSQLLQTAINFANGNKKRVFVVSIPDWGITPYGKSSGRDVKMISSEIDAFNLANKEITLAAGVNYTDITPQSRNAEKDLSLVAQDGLHPSEKMYAEWATALNAKIVAELK